MPRFNDSKAATADTSLESFPIISATDLFQTGAVIQMWRKRTATTEFGPSVVVDFDYADDPYNSDGFRDQHYTCFFSAEGIVAKQLKDQELTLNDPLECIIIRAGARAYKLADPSEVSPTQRQGARSAAPASAPAPSRVAAPAGRAPAPSTPAPAQTAGADPTGDEEEVPF